MRINDHWDVFHWDKLGAATSRKLRPTTLRRLSMGEHFYLAASQMAGGMGYLWSTAGHVERLDFVGSLNIVVLSGWWIWPYTGAQVSESATFQAYICRCPTILDSSCRSNLPAEHGNFAVDWIQQLWQHVATLSGQLLSQISATTTLQLMQRCRCWRKRWIASGQRRVPGQGPARGEDLLFRWLQKITSWGRSPHFWISKYIQYAKVWFWMFIIRIGL